MILINHIAGLIFALKLLLLKLNILLERYNLFCTIGVGRCIEVLIDKRGDEMKDVVDMNYMNK